MSAEGPGNLPPRPPLKRSASESLPARETSEETGSTRDGRTASETEARTRQPRPKKRRLTIQPLDLTMTNLTPMEEAQPKLTVSPQKRRLSSPNIFASPIKTPVMEEIKSLWQQLDLRKPSPQKCPDQAPCAFKFNADEIVSKTAIFTPEGKLTPYNRITLDGVNIGVAARGPKTSEQAEVFFNVALQENCAAITNLTTPLEGIVDNYPPDPGATSVFGQVKVSRPEAADGNNGDSAQLMDLKPVHTHIRVESGEQSRELPFHWERGMLNHVSAAPEMLISISEALPAGPVLVHCQKGIGRTAMVMLVHGMRIKKQQGLAKDQAIATLVRMIEDGRQCRGEFLENDRQLQSVLKAVAQMYGLSNDELIQAVKTLPVG